MTKRELSGIQVVSFESRRSAEMAALIEKRGGVALSAPSMREVELTDETVSARFTEQLVAGQYDGLVMLSGGGTRKLLEAAGRMIPQDELTEALARIWLICRGPKPKQVLKDYDLEATLVAPEPNTTRELIRELDSKLELVGKRLAVQEYGESNTALLGALAERGATTIPLLVYEWKLPRDLTPLKLAIQRLCDSTVDAALFTSARQVVHVFQVAETLGLAEALTDAMQRQVVVSIGPVTSAALAEYGIPPSTEPEHPKMGHLVSHLARNWETLRRS